MGDVGVSLNSNMEKQRLDIKDIIFANMKRVEESLRVLEEVFKLIDVQTAFVFKRLRYRAYILEKEIIDESERINSLPKI